MSQPSKYLDYIYNDLSEPYPIIRRGNSFYLGVQNGTTGAYYAELIRIKSQTFDTF